MPTRLENWMADIRDDALLKEVVIPATHDAGMVKKFCSKGALSKDNYSTQLLTVGDQVRVGVRQLDLRISAHGSVLKAFHGGDDAGTDMQSRLGLRAYGESWEDICRGLATFIREHPSELVILKMDKQDAHTTDLMRVMLRVVNEVCNTPLPPLNLAGTLDLSECPLGRLRGRLYVCGSGQAIADWRNVVSDQHARIIIGQWHKSKRDLSGVDPVNDCQGRFRYVLIGDSGNSLNPTKSGEALVNGVKLKEKYAKADRENGVRRVGMRGIWFNNISMTADIQERAMKLTWAPTKEQAREATWIYPGPYRQNVASLDFVDMEKSLYVIAKNANRSWRNGAAPDWMGAKWTKMV